jgi:hypothetical protein
MMKLLMGQEEFPINRKIGLFLLFFFGFLIWLFSAIYYSSGNEWWTVIEVRQTSYDTLTGSVSFKRVMAGVLIFIIVGFSLYEIILKR